MKIKTLSEVPLDQIYESFCAAFENYVIPVTFNKELTLKRWERACVDFEISYGAFDENNKLAAFVLQIRNEENLYNFATGVVPAFRGKHLIEEIYSRIASEQNAKSWSLEVIRENTKALNLYKKIGFREIRELVSFTGKFESRETEDRSFVYNVLPLKYTVEMDDLTLACPGEEFSRATNLKLPHVHEVHELRSKDQKLLAYTIFTPETMTIREFGSSAPLDQHLDQLLIRMKLNGENLRVMNIDGKAQGLIDFLKTRGLSEFVTQYEMLKTF